jgi:hypothetical protein
VETTLALTKYFGLLGSLSQYITIKQGLIKVSADMAEPVAYALLGAATKICGWDYSGEQACLQDSNYIYLNCNAVPHGKFCDTEHKVKSDNWM